MRRCPTLSSTGPEAYCKGDPEAFAAEHFGQIIAINEHYPSARVDSSNETSY